MDREAIGQTRDGIGMNPERTPEQRLNDEKNRMIEVIILAFPLSEQIKDWDLFGASDAIRFSWRGTRFRVGVETLSVSTVNDCFSTFDDMAILVESLLKRVQAQREEQAA